MQQQGGEASSASPRTPDRSGERVAERYELLERVGEGAMGSVYRAMHTELRKVFAVKILHPELCRDDESVARFQREAQAAAHLDHPNVCAASDFGRTSDGAFFLVMEFLEGETLAERLARLGALPPAEVVELARQLVAALTRAHNLDVVHRDLKPDNILLARREGEHVDRAKILDFGIARVHLAALEAEDDEAALRSTLSRAGAIYGTPRYLSPEQASGEPADARSDLYALGVVLYEMLAGHPPFVAPTTLALIGMHMTRVPEPLPPHVPAALCAIVMRLLEKEPDARFASAAELAAALDEVADTMSGVLPALDLGATPRPASLREHPALVALAARAAQWRERIVAGERRAVLAAAGAAVGLLVLGILLGVAIFGGGGDDDAAARDERELTASGSEAEVAASESVAAAAEAVGAAAPVVEIPLEAREDVAAALKLLEDGFIDAGLARLAELEPTYGDSPAFWRLLRDRQLAHGKLAPALQSIERLAALEPDTLHEPETFELLFRALDERRGDAPDAAAALLQRHLDLETATALAERAVAMRRGGRAQRRVFELLAKSEHGAALEDWLRVSIEVLDTSRGQCSRRRALVERLVALGDPRALPTIEALASEPRDGCGLLDLSDCSECMRGTLRDAKSALSGAAAP